MSTAAAETHTLRGLSTALDAGRFPRSVLPRAEELRDQLATPARLTVFGPAKSGKTGVLNLLAGGAVVPPGLDLGTIRVEHDDREWTEFTFADGETARMGGLPTASNVRDRAPVLTRIAAPLPVLTRISLMELGAAGDPATQARAMKWAIKQTDISIWCTAEFAEPEAALWAHVPDRLRDHAILLRTRADQLGHERDAALAALTKLPGYDFAYALHVSVQEANRAAAAGRIDKAAMRASGAKTLISTILGEIEAGRQNLVDQANVLLRMHPEVDLAAAAAQTAPAAPAPARSDAELAALRIAAQRLSEVGHRLVGSDTLDADTVLRTSADTLGWLSEHLDDPDLPGSDDLSHLRNMTQDAEDLVQLMRMESAESGQVDAVLTLLQLKRGFQSALAA